MNRLKEKWNKNNFSIYQSEEKTVLRLIQNIFNFNKEIIDELENKTDKNGNHLGQWQGLDKPTMSVEGTTALVEKLAREQLPVINAKSMGAKGDGITDDTVAIQNVIDKLHETGGKIYFPVGVYLISKTLIFYDNVSFEFETDVISKNCLRPVLGGNYIKNYLILINSLDGVTPYKPVSSASSDHMNYKGLNINNLVDISVNKNTIVQGLKGVFLSQAHCKLSRLIGYGLDSMVVLNPTQYLDNIIIEDSFFLGTNNYQIMKEGSGENLTIRNCKVYESIQNGGLNWKLAKVNDTFNLLIENCINGGIEIERSSFLISNCHIEKGQIICKYSRGSIKNTSIYHPPISEKYYPIALTGDWSYLISLEDVEFLMTPHEHYIGEIAQPYDLFTNMGILTFKNVTRKMFVNYKDSTTTGIWIDSTDNNLKNSFNRNSSQLSINGEIKQGGVFTPLRYINDRYNGNDFIKLSTNALNPYTWHNIETNLVYTCQIIYGDPSKLIGCNMTNDVSIYASTKPIEIEVQAEYLNRNATIRLYRGTEHGKYSAYVDIPSINQGKLMDTGTQVNGFPWIYGDYNLSTLSNQFDQSVKYLLLDCDNEIVKKVK